MNSINLSNFGNYYAGGTTVEVSGQPQRQIQVTRDITLDFDPNGSFAVEHAYVQFFVPAQRNQQPPVVLQHGGGMSGACWETTPDGRPGWLNHLLHRGYEVHVVDNVERGRAGWVPDHWQGDPTLRSMEDAWTLFRFGEATNFESRRAYEGQQFPVEQLEGFARGFCPRWTSTTPVQATALIAVLEKTGPAILISHSQGGELAFDAALARPGLVTALIALEPSGSPRNPDALRNIPLRIVHGDYLDRDAIWPVQLEAWKKLTGTLTDLGAGVELIDLSATVAPGSSHMMMMDRESEQNLSAALAD